MIIKNKSMTNENNDNTTNVRGNKTIITVMKIMKILIITITVIILRAIINNSNLPGIMNMTYNLK